jgi:tetratricopeptide (TPR) repeat protein
VFEHNRQDILSLAALAVLACQWVDEGQAEDPRDVFSLARVLERARLYDRCQEEYRRTLALDAGPLRGPALLRLAWRAKRARDWPAAIVLWEEAAAEGEIEALRELAMHHEHRGRDYPAALAVAERAVRLLASVEDDPRSRRLLDGFRRRMQRIARKLKARGKAACN